MAASERNGPSSSAMRMRSLSSVPAAIVGPLPPAGRPGDST
jgi:hypothetical protein